MIARLPGWLRPRAAEVPNRRLWALETAALALVGVVLAVVATNDISWTVQDSGVRVADQNTWRHYTHRDYFNVSAGPLTFGDPVDVSCADATPGPPGERVQICLMLTGPAVHGIRTVSGGWRIP
ncbi:MAG TPA: hypothetical protein VIJ20_06060, partial [Solirubrobacteraceae bacterium]